MAALQGSPVTAGPMNSCTRTLGRLPLQLPHDLLHRQRDDVAGDLGLPLLMQRGFGTSQFGVGAPPAA